MGSMKVFGDILNGFCLRGKLSDEQKKAFYSEKGLKDATNLRFISVVVLFVVVFFGVVDYFIIEDAAMYKQLNFVRYGFAFLFLIPFVVYYHKNKKQVPQFVILINTMGYVVYLFSLSYIASANVQAIFHNTVGLVLVNVMLFVLFGLKRYNALLVSLLMFFLLNINYVKFNSLYSLSISRFDVLLWYTIITGAGFVLNLHIERMQIRSFIVNWELKEVTQSRYKLFNIVSHDLKNIISSQSTITDFLNITHNNISTDELTKMLSLLNKSSNDALNLFNDLMAWIKSQLVIVKPEISDVDFGKFIDHQIEQFALVLDVKEIKFDKSGIEIDKIQTDATILSLALRNVVGNAIKYSKAGSKVEIKAKKHNKRYRIQVTDSGIGIPKEHIERLFDYTKLNSEKGTMGEGGTGMGLVLTKDLLKHIDGNIMVESNLGVGTSVLIDVPNFELN